VTTPTRHYPPKSFEVETTFLQGVQKMKKLFLHTRSVVLNLYTHAESLRSFPSFCRTQFLPNITKSKKGLHKSDDLRQTPETAPWSPRGSIEPRLRTTAPDPCEVQMALTMVKNSICLKVAVSLVAIVLIGSWL